MKYMILIYGNMQSWKAMDADSFSALMAAHTALQEELRGSSELTGAGGVTSGIRVGG